MTNKEMYEIFVNLLALLFTLFVVAYVASST